MSGHVVFVPTCSGAHGREEEQEQADVVYGGHWSHHNLWVKFYIEHSAADRVFDIVEYTKKHVTFKRTMELKTFHYSAIL